MAFDGVRLREAREAMREHGRPVSQERFAEMIGASRRSPVRWENGRAQPRMAQLAEITRVTGRDMSWFFGDGAATAGAASNDLVTALNAYVEKAVADALAKAAGDVASPKVAA